MGVARDPPSDRIHCCRTEPLRTLVPPIGVCIGRPFGSVGALARSGRRSRARRARRARSVLAPPHNLTPLHHSPSPPHQSHLSNLAPPHQPAPSHFHPLTLSPPTSAPRVLLPGLINHRGIGRPIPRSHPPLNVRPQLGRDTQVSWPTKTSEASVGIRSARCWLR